MADWDDVGRAVAALPEVTEGTGYGSRAWRVRKAMFAWERPLGRKELSELAEDAPEGDVLAVSVPDEGAKQALLVEAWLARAPRTLARQLRSP